MSKVALSYLIALPLAEDIKAQLAPGCERIEIAGSLRRERPVIGDIEIVCIPRYQVDMFGAVAYGQPSYLDAILSGLVAEGRLLPGKKNGKKFKQFIIPHAVSGSITLDLFITTPDRWGVIFVIRTGPVSFSKRLVTKQVNGGLLPDDCFVNDGRVWQNGGALDTPEEVDVLALAGGWVEPQRRAE